MTDTSSEWLEDPTVRLVMGDLTDALNVAFPPVRGQPFAPAPGLPWPIGAAGTVAVAWEYRGFEQLNPLGRSGSQQREVTVRGITVVVGEGEKALFHRYIDWAGVYDQLGMVPGRPSMGDPQRAVVGDELLLVAPKG